MFSEPYNNYISISSLLRSNKGSEAISGDRLGTNIHQSISEIAPIKSSNQCKIFYHIFCNDNTKQVVTDQINKIIFSGLYENLSKIFCFITGKQEYIQVIINILQKSGKKFQIMAIGVDDTTYERFTLLKIREFIVPGEKILYIHTKGVKHNDNEHYIGWQPGLPIMKDNVTEWRTFMEYYLIHKHKECIKLLDEYDIVGVNYGENPDHYSGNFWWCTSDYFLKLDNQIGDGYCDPEFYVCTKPHKSYSLAMNIKACYLDNINYVDYIDN